MSRFLHYVAPETITNPAVESQAVGTAMMLQSNLGLTVHFYSLFRQDQQGGAGRIAQRLTDSGIRVHLYRNPHDLRGFLGHIGTLLRIILDLRRNSAACPGTVLTRNLYGALVGLLATRMLARGHYVVDLRGHAGAELEMAGKLSKGGLRRWFFNLWERVLLDRASSVLCVSQPLAAYVKGKARRRQRCRVVPSCLDAASESELARTLDADLSEGSTSPLIAYVGTLTQWNTARPMLELFERIERAFPKARLLCMTPQVDEARAIVRRQGLCERCEIVCVPHDEVICSLRKADVGLLLRENSPVNRVASPVKAAEYLAAGLPIIATRGIGDISRHIETEGIGFLLPSLSPGDWPIEELTGFLAEVIARRADYRVRCVAAARRQFVRSNYAATYREVLLGVHH